MMAPSFLQMRILQALAACGVVWAAIWSDAPAWWWLVSLGAYFITGCLGLSVTMHRALTHRAVTLVRPLELVFTLFGVLGGSGSSIGWTAMHRAHHSHSDTEKDPHALHKSGWRVVFSIYDYDFDPRHARDLLRDKAHLFLHRYYNVISMVWALALAEANPRACVFLFLVPAFVQITISNLANVLAHGRHGYRRYDTGDDSSNTAVISILAWGEGWHNNHHAAPCKWNFSRAWYEIDPGALVIAALIRLGLAR
jgi:stearoyl-CoA desaturase (delta-9 desaturase)